MFVILRNSSLLKPMILSSNIKKKLSRLGFLLSLYFHENFKAGKNEAKCFHFEIRGLDKERVGIA